MPRGGMRWGAGRPAEKGKAEACLRLDVRDMAKRRALRPGRGGTWAWTNTVTGEPIGHIDYRIEADTLVLDYRLNGESRLQRVSILTTPCHYGGTRPWLTCPHCAARVAVIFLRRGGFYCRKCAEVAYYSQSEDVCGRAWRKQQKAEAKLGTGWARPKGMHKSTRERLLETIFSCEDRREDEIARFIARYAGALGSL